MRKFLSYTVILALVASCSRNPGSNPSAAEKNAVTPAAAANPNPSAADCATPSYFLGLDARRPLINRIYQTMLGRAPSDTEMTAQLAVLSTGIPTSQFVAAVYQSLERRQFAITNDYLAYLGRSPDPSGLAYWMAFLAAGNSDAELAIGILTSPEYFAKQGGTPSGYIAGLYRDLLGRSGSPAEIAGWLPYPQNAIVAGFLTSPEFGTRYLDEAYQLYLNRVPDPSGLQTGLPLVANLVSGWAQIPVWLLSSAESRELGVSDSAVVLNSCLAQIPAGGQLLLPGGRYYLKNQLVFNQGILLQTYGKVYSDPRCNGSDTDNTDCAQFIPFGSFGDNNGLLWIHASSGSRFDHVVVYGNKQYRALVRPDLLQASYNSYGYSVSFDSCINCSFTNSRIDNTFFGTSLQFGPGSGAVLIDNNEISHSGDRWLYFYFADCLTQKGGYDFVFTNNLLRYCTDVFALFASCPDCTIEQNVLVADDPKEAGNAGIFLGPWPGMVGDFSGTSVAWNQIGTQVLPLATIVFGLSIGANPWYSVMSYGAGTAGAGPSAVIHDNGVINAAVGVAINDGVGFTVFGNSVQLPSSDSVYVMPNCQSTQQLPPMAYYQGVASFGGNVFGPGESSLYQTPAPNGNAPVLGNGCLPNI